MNLTLQNLPKTLTLKDFQNETSKDEILQRLIVILKSGINENDKLSEPLKSYLTHLEELSVSSDGIVLRGPCLVVPAGLQDAVLNIAHRSHQGIAKTKQLLRSKVWFPAMDKKIESLVKDCEQCKWTSVKKYNLPIKMTPFPGRPWAALALDFAHLAVDKYLFIGIDLYSKYPFVKFVSSTSFRTVEDVLDEQFSVWGLPDTIFTDNGPPFSSHDFKQYLQNNGISHRASIPLWPQSNGQAERFIRSLKKIIKISDGEAKNIKKAVNNFLLYHRNTPQRLTGKSPVEILMSYKPRTPFFPGEGVNPQIDQQIRSRVESQQLLQKTYADETRNAAPMSNLHPGQLVLLKRQQPTTIQTPWHTEKYTVTKIDGSNIRIEHDGQVLWRHRSLLQPAGAGESAQPSVPVRDPEPVVSPLPVNNSNVLITSESNLTKPTCAVPVSPRRSARPNKGQHPIRSDDNWVFKK